MLRVLIAILLITCNERDCWKPIVVNAKRSYFIRNEGKSFKPLYLLNEERITAELVIDGDTANVIKMGTSIPFSMADTVKIELFDNGPSYAHSFKIVILKEQYLIQYNREIVGADLVQKFEAVKTKLELNSLDLSKGSKIRVMLNTQVIV